MVNPWFLPGEVDLAASMSILLVSRDQLRFRKDIDAEAQLEDIRSLLLLYESLGTFQAFIEDISLHPTDMAPRLILADWLDEHTIWPDWARFIRLQNLANRMAQRAGEVSRDSSPRIRKRHARLSLDIRRVKQEAQHILHRPIVQSWVWHDHTTHNLNSVENLGAVTIPLSYSTILGWRGGFPWWYRGSLDYWEKYGHQMVRAYPILRVSLTDPRMDGALRGNPDWGFLVAGLMSADARQEISQWDEIHFVLELGANLRPTPRLFRYTSRSMRYLHNTLGMVAVAPSRNALVKSISLGALRQAWGKAALPPGVEEHHATES